MTQRFSFAVLRMLVGLVGMLPGGVARKLGELSGLAWYLASGKRKRMARRHMSRVLGGRAPGPPPNDGPTAEITRTTRAVFKSYGRYWAETLWVRPRRIPELQGGLDIRGLEHLKKAAVDGNGVIITLPHLGNWETAALAGDLAGIEIVAVAERLRNVRLTEWFTSIRKQFGINIVLAGRGSMRSIEKAIERGSAVCLLCDRDLKGRGVEVMFFGELTTLPAGPAALAIRTGAPLLMGACYFTKGGHLLVLEPLTMPTEAKDIGAVTQQIAYGLERLIRAAPEQWHLLQPNWPSDKDDQKGARAQGTPPAESV